MLSGDGGGWHGRLPGRLRNAHTPINQELLPLGLRPRRPCLAHVHSLLSTPSHPTSVTPLRTCATPHPRPLGGVSARATFIGGSGFRTPGRTLGKRPCHPPAKESCEKGFTHERHTAHLASGRESCEKGFTHEQHTWQAAVPPFRCRGPLASARALIGKRRSHMREHVRPASLSGGFRYSSAHPRSASTCLHECRQFPSRTFVYPWYGNRVSRCRELVQASTGPAG
jgi:hypothetical protein